MVGQLDYTQKYNNAASTFVTQRLRGCLVGLSRDSQSTRNFR